MDRTWLVVAFITAAVVATACTSSISYSAVGHAYIQTTRVPRSAAIDDITAFMASHGYVLDSQVTLDRGGRASVDLSFSNGTNTIVSVDDRSAPNCYNFDVFVESTSHDYMVARAIENAFVSHFARNPDWEIKRDDSCRIAS